MTKKLNEAVKKDLSTAKIWHPFAFVWRKIRIKIGEYLDNYFKKIQVRASELFRIL